MGSFLNDTCAFAVVLAHHNEHATGDAGRRQIGKRIGSHVGAHDGLPSDCASNWVVDGGAQHGRSRSLVGASLYMHAQLVHVRLCLHHDIEQM